MEELNLIQRIAVWAIPVLFAITVHETAHGWMALRLGDPTAKMLGRLTLNPIPHIDPVGTILVPIGLLTMSTLMGGAPFLIGWAKPVPITAENLRNPRRDMAYVAIAGPASNLLMAIFWALMIQLGATVLHTSQGVGEFLINAGQAGILINAILLALNILPLPPLDGSRVVSSLLPPRLAWNYDRLESFGFPILLLLLVTGILGAILYPIINLVWNTVTTIVGL
ncbi:MAG: site-2 protease family protein [Pseudomonadota bacterium]